MQTKSKKHVEQISFVLQNIFIVHPNPNSKYKIRLIVNRNDSNNSFRKVSNRYIFKISNDLAQLKDRACYIVLLEKTKKEGQNSDYVEIGKGEISLTQIIEDEQIRNESLINGVVYGTRSYNYDRIIGKYSYKVSKVQGSSPQNRIKKTQPSSNSPKKSPMSLSKSPTSFIKSPSKLVASKQMRKQKAPFIFEESIQQQQRDLQSKIKELAQSMNKIIGKDIEEPYQQSQRYLTNKLLPIKQSVLDQNEYYYKYNDKFAQQLNLQSLNPKQHNVLTIKNIRVENRNKQPEAKQMLDTLTVENPITHGAKKYNSSKKMEEILLVFYQLFEEKRVRKRLLEIYLPLHPNKDNRNLTHQLFYLPNTNNKILIEISFITGSHNKQKNLNGVIHASAAKSRLIELFDIDNQEKGIFICQIQSCTDIDKEEVKAYKKQSTGFDKILRKHGNVSQFVKKIKQTQIKEDLSLKQPKTLDNKLKDTLYSNFHGNKEPKKIKRKRYTTSIDEYSGQLGINTPSISRYNKSQTKSNHNLNLSQKNSTRMFSKSIRAFPTMLQSVVKKGNKESYFNSQGTKYRLYLQSVQCEIYQMNDRGTKFLLKLSINGRNQSKKLVVSQKEWHPLHVQFKQFSIKDSLTAQLLVNKRNTTVYKKVGKSDIMISQMQDSKNKYKAFVFQQNKDIGYLVFKFKMFRKEADQKSQSFYYQEDFQRQSLIKSDHFKAGQKSQYQDLDQSILIHTETDRSFDKIDYKRDQNLIDVSLDTKEIEVANSVHEHNITQRASEGRVSELLENEDYQNGETIHRRF